MTQNRKGELCYKCIQFQVATLEVRLEADNEEIDTKTITLCGDCLKEVTTLLELKDQNGNIGENFTLQTDEYNRYLENKK